MCTILRPFQLALGLLVCLQASTVLGQLFVPDDFEPGDQYRIAFLTFNEYQATSSDIADYNAFVQADGDSQPLTEGPTYFAIASTPTEDAIDNIGASTAPIFTVLSQPVAPGGTSDLFDGSILNPINIKPNATVEPGPIEVWTGTGTDGLVFPDQGLGAGIGADIRFGDGPARNGNWISSGGDSFVEEKFLYAISEVITVPEPPPFFVPSDLNPGDEYRIAFFTQSQRSASDTDIAEYNSFVNSQASESTLTVGVDYAAIASTETVDARDSFGASSAPIYLLNDTLLANGTDDLWDGSILNQFRVDQFGTFSDRGDVDVWTGSGSDGTAFPDGWLGADTPRTGQVQFQGNGWISNATATASNGTNHFYAISEVLTVASGPDPLLGDVNLDDEVNGLDVDPFVDVLLNGPYQAEADMNEDDAVNGLDVDPFVAAVVGSGAQSVPEPSTLLLCIVALAVVGGWRKWGV